MVKQNTTIIYENTVAGTFVRRMNRFTAEVLIDGAPQIVHVKNTGHLQELLMPEAKVTLQKTWNPNRKTAYDLISVYKPKLKWVNIDSLAPNALMKQQLMSLNYELVKPEYTYGESRIDFYIVNNHLYFGEITLYTASGFQRMIPEEMDYKLGQMIKLPNRKEI